MEDLRPDEELEAKEFEAATRSKWQRPNFPQLPNRPRLPKRPNTGFFRNKWFIGFVILLVILFGGRWLHHVLKSDGTKTSRPTTAVQTTPSTNKTPAAATTPATTPSPSQTPNQVPNTGPGDTAAIFAAAVFVAGSAHYMITSRKSR